MRSIPWFRAALTTILAASAHLSPPAAAQKRAEGGATLARWEGPSGPTYVAIGAALRESRTADGPAVQELAERIENAGSDSTPVMLEILARGRVPETSADDAPQILSVPQRDILLSALGRAAPKTVRAAIGDRLDTGTADPRLRIAAVHAFGAIGEARDLERLVSLAPREAGEKRLTGEARDALTSASAAILQRDPRAFPALAKILRRCDQEVAGALLDSLGSARNPRALQVLVVAAQTQSALAPQVAARAAVCGNSTDPSIDREFTAWAAAALEHARPEFARSLLQALGAVDDGTHVHELIAWLADEDPGVRDSALWALRKASRLGLPATPDSWTLWNRGEIAWHTRERAKLREDLVSRNTAVVVAALRAYAEHRTRRTELAGEVADVLSSANPALRRLACEVLGELGSPSACGPLARLLADPDPSVREAAWLALRVITGIDLPRDPDRLRELLQLS